MRLTFFALLVTSIPALAANQGLRLFSDSTHLKDLPKQTIFRIERDILVPAGTRTVYFYEGQSSHHGDHSYLGTSNFNKKSDGGWSFTVEKLNPLFGCDLILKSKPIDAKVIRAKTDLETELVTASDLSYELYQKGLTVYPFTGSLFLVTFKIKNSEILGIRCGATRPDELTKGYLRKHLGSVSLFAPPLEAIQ